MNRTEQAPEPTMEEILASIRLIISDDAKKEPSGREDHQIRPAQARDCAAQCVAGRGCARSDGSARFSRGAAIERRSRQHDTNATQCRPLRLRKSLQRRSHTRNRTRLQRNQRPHKLWIRRRRLMRSSLCRAPRMISRVPRRLPRARFGRGANFRALPRPLRRPFQDMKRQHDSRKEIGPRTFKCPFRIAARSRWFQLRRKPRPWRRRTHIKLTSPMEAGNDAGSPNLGDKGEATVAALAESLARSAAEAMNSDELATASDVDFSKLGEEQKAEVTETFANAIQRESAPRDRRPLPTLLDEVFRQDFIREPAQDENLSET